MRKGNFFRWIVPLYLYFYMAFSLTAVAQDEVKNYVVVGAFEHENNAQEWVAYSKSQNLDAQYQKNPERGLYYVYIYQGGDREKALSLLKEVWEMNKYYDAWIFKGDLDGHLITSELLAGNTPGEEISQVEGPEDQAHDDSAPPEQLTPKKSVENLRQEVVIDMELPEDARTGDSPQNLGDFSVFFNLYDARDYTDIKGEVKIIDAERAKLVQTLNSGEYVTVNDPNNGSGKVSLLVETFGYRSLQHEINYYNPLSDTSNAAVDLIGDVKVYHFPLVRYHKGDIVTMYNVYFFVDAAIMRPESSFEMQRLLDLMKSNPNYKIKIHGHTNGNSPGKIITTGPDHDFFALTDDDDEGFGSAKKLSEARANVIRDFLINEGIASKRMEVKAWGGKRMLYDKHSNQAKNNVRVEIEILEE